MENLTALRMEKAWLDGDDAECQLIVDRLAAVLGCDRYTLYGAFTNLAILAAED